MVEGPVEHMWGSGEEKKVQREYDLKPKRANKGEVWSET